MTKAMLIKAISQLTYIMGSYNYHLVKSNYNYESVQHELTAVQMVIDAYKRIGIKIDYGVTLKKGLFAYVEYLEYKDGAILQWVTSCDITADESTMNMLKRRKSDYLVSAYYIDKNKLIEY